jgi:hypothetical protein
MMHQKLAKVSKLLLRMQLQKSLASKRQMSFGLEPPSMKQLHQEQRTSTSTFSSIQSLTSVKQTLTSHLHTTKQLRLLSQLKAQQQQELPALLIFRVT